MEFCEKCGSTSHDEQGFCRGCGARLDGVGAPSFCSSSTGPRPFPPPAESKATVGSIPLAHAQVKNVWVAVLYALLLGPLGMLYCTIPGALVMFAVSIVALFFMTKILVWILLPIVCAVWAGLAARSANSIY